MRLRRGWLGAVVVWVLTGACATSERSHRPFFHNDKEDNPAFSKARLGDPFDEDSAADFLSADERRALERSGYRMEDSLVVDQVEEAAPDGEEQPAKADDQEGGMHETLDKAAKVTVAILGVGVTLGMMAAPYLLF